MADTKALSYAQQKSALWSRDGARVHAVIDGLAVPGLAARLAEADVVGWDCLERGALKPDAAERAAYVVDLRRESPFTDWLLTVATSVHPRWGLLMVSTQTLLAMRQHCRDLGIVAGPGTERRTWRWYDPEVLELLLPTFSAAQMDEVFALGQSMVILSQQAWTWHAMEQGLLASSVRPIMPTAS